MRCFIAMDFGHQIVNKKTNKQQNKTKKPTSASHLRKKMKAILVRAESKRLSSTVQFLQDFAELVL